MTSTGELLKKIDCGRYFDQFIALEGVFPDGRDVEQFRPLGIDLGVDKQAYGSAYVRQGGACVSCSVALSVAPNSDEPPIEFTLDAMESVPEELLGEAESRLDELLKRGYLLDADALKVEKRSPTDHDLRWTLHLKIIVISSDGFLMDALLTAVQAALLDTTLPTLEYTGATLLEEDLLDEEIKLPFEASHLKLTAASDHDHDHGKKLPLKDTLACTSLLFYNTGSNEIIILADPNAELVALMPSGCEFIVGSEGSVYSTEMFCSEGISAEVLAQVTGIAERRHSTVAAALEKCSRRG